MPSVLIVDPDPEARSEVTKALANADFLVREAASAGEAIELIRCDAPDLIVLDMFLKDQSGFAVCRNLRAHPRTQAVPILVLIPSDSEQDRILALESGADDVVPRPFYARELALRLRALLRRARRDPFSAGEKELRFGPLRVDPQRRSAQIDDSPLDLTEKEFSILALLIRRPDRVYRREEILSEIWGTDDARTLRVVDTHVKGIRRKLGLHANMIESLHGVGYRLTDQLAAP